MAAKTRLGLDGYGVRRAGSFAGKSPETGGAHPVSLLTRLSPDGYGARRNASFSGKSQSSSSGGPHPVSKVTRLGPDGYGARRYQANAFANKATDAPDPGGQHPVSRLTRLSIDGYGARRNGSFAGKTHTTSVQGAFRSFIRWIGGFALAPVAYFKPRRLASSGRRSNRISTGSRPGRKGVS